MKKRQRIKENKEFQKVFKEGKSFANRQFVVYCLPREGQKEFRIGLSVGKKIGKAVTRNKVKRYIRQSFLELKDDLRQDMDYVIIARLPAANLNYHETKKSLEHVLKIAKVLNKKKVSKE
ncbi:ribonuclease P protein component [Ureibacillus sp. FSL K6-8385]|uniref:Ribonuclease P protein component n=1 Tax=Ureibacillus terrenus TaxID=118246 RepID=A0A540V2Z4_9BACL|nr:ribonuclease P protein component [Ureibacillus terrenus]MED3661610.1 ribonuclease P protein component [Ureibacillus terrenus]MED3763629.1 ribonuclease P protein component [Ureibacillus terrenus]TQE91110.1 ribonuclease P protein component [Ureibacillus terrenus]